jgi:hypothetical protein
MRVTLHSTLQGGDDEQPSVIARVVMIREFRAVDDYQGVKANTAFQRVFTDKLPASRL